MGTCKADLHCIEMIEAQKIWQSEEVSQPRGTSREGRGQSLREGEQGHRPLSLPLSLIGHADLERGVPQRQLSCGKDTGGVESSCGNGFFSLISTYSSCSKRQTLCRETRYSGTSCNPNIPGDEQEEEAGAQPGQFSRTASRNKN